MQKPCWLSTVGMIFSLLTLLTLFGCQGLVSNPTTTTTSTTPTTTPPPTKPPGSLQSVNHIVFMAQENRSFDSYFGQLSAYWAANGFPAQQFDGLPANASNPSYSANGGSTTPISAFHVATECVDNLSPSWDESHVDWNLNEPIGPTATLDGFAHTA